MQEQETQPSVESPSAPDVQAQQESSSIDQTMIDTYDRLVAKEDDITSQEDVKSEAAEEVVTSGDEADAGNGDAVVAQDSAKVEPPAAWNAEAKKTFSTLPEDVQQYIALREEQAHRGITQKGSELAKIKRVFDPLANMLRQADPSFDADPTRGINAVGQLLQAAKFAQDSPEKFIADFASRRGIDLGELAKGTPKTAQAKGKDPSVVALEQRLDAVQRAITRPVVEREQQQKVELQKFVLDFADETDESGAPLRPYYNDVAPAMAGHVELLIKQHPEWTHGQYLEKAYEQAAWANPYVREQLIKAKASFMTDKQRQEALRAKKAGGTRVHSSLPPAKPDKPRTLDETLLAVYDAAMAR